MLGLNKNTEFLTLVVDALVPCHKLEQWRTNIGWNMNFKCETKQVYRGLVNPGCICYMNSLLQQLFMIESFQKALLDLDTTSQTVHQHRITEEEEESGENKMVTEESVEQSS